MNDVSFENDLSYAKAQQESLERRLHSDQRVIELSVEAKSRRLGETLVAMGYLKPRQIQQISAIQEKTGEPFGRLAVVRGYVKPDQIQAAIGVQYGFLRDIGAPVSIPRKLKIVRRPHSAQAEQIRLMRTRLLTSCDPQSLKVISLIDIGQDSAGVELGINLGAAFSQLHRRILLVDANLRSPSLARLFELEDGETRQTGLAEYLSGRVGFEDSIQETLVNRLDIIAGGQRCYNPQILLSSEKFNMLLDRARREYDMVLLVSTGFGPIADGQFVWQKSDSAIAVVRKNHSRESELKQLAATLYDLQTPLLGAVLATG